MKFVVFFDYDMRYLLSPISRTISHSIESSFAISGNRLSLLNPYVTSLNSIDYDAIMIAVQNWHHQEKILSILRKMNIHKKVYIVKSQVAWDRLPVITEKERLLEDRFIILADGAFEPYLGSINGHICDHCNLNCKACNNYSPFVKGRSLASLDKWSMDVQRIANSNIRIGSWFLLGGEPLLEPELTKDFLKVTRHFVPKTDITVHTNGILIPQMKEDFWESFVENDITLSITFYPPYYDKASVWWDILDRYGVSHRHRSHDKFRIRLTEYPSNSPNMSLNYCNTSGCHYMRDGYLYKCVDAFFLKFVDAECGTNFLREDAGISLDTLLENPLLTLDELLKPIDVCRYCNTMRTTNINWEKVNGKPKLEDWLLPEYDICNN